jgi:hypothetical protein
VTKRLAGALLRAALAAASAQAQPVGTAFHRIPVEEDKSEAERGTYMHPTEHGQPPERGVGWEHRLTGVPRS